MNVEADGIVNNKILQKSRKRGQAYCLSIKLVPAANDGECGRRTVGGETGLQLSNILTPKPVLLHDNKADSQILQIFLLQGLQLLVIRYSLMSKAKAMHHISMSGTCQYF